MKFKLALLIFLNSFWLLAQENASVTYSNTPLSDVISDIEEKFDIKLSFNSELIKNQFVTFQQEDILLFDLFVAIEEQSNIKFSQVSDRYYILKKQSKVNLSETQQLDEVVIKEYIISGIYEKDDGSINLSPKDLGILPGLTEPDVLQSIQLLPGVQSPTETASGLYIRGGTPDQNLILWDGIKMYHSGHFFGMLSAFNPYITKEIKLYKGGTKAQYGNRISGVIDIASDNDIPQTTEGGFGFNMTHADLHLKAPLSKSTAILFSARRSFTDAFKTETFKNLSKRVFQDTKISQGNKVFDDDEVTTTKDLFYFSDLTFKVITEPSDTDKITFSNLFTKNKLDYGFLIEEFNEASTDKLDIKNIGTSLLWDHYYSKSFSHNFNAYYSNFDLNYIGTNSIIDEFSDQLDKENRIDDFGISLDFNWKVNASNILGFGYQYSSNKVTYALGFQDSESPEEEYSETNTVTNNSQALYIDYKYVKKDNWFINLGLRSNYVSVLDKFFIEPRLQFEAKLLEHLKFKISAERLHQAVSQVVEFNTQEFGLENQIWVLSDGERIPVLKSTQFTTGFVFSKTGWHIGLEGYYKDIQGLTSFTIGFDNADDFFSQGKSKVLGLDLLIKKKINKYRTWLSYSLINNEFTFADINSGNSFPGNFDITHHLNWSHTYEWYRFNVSLGWNIRTGIPYTRALGISETNGGFVIDYDETNKERLPNYHRLDISTTYKFNISENGKWKGKLGFSLLNIYNKKNTLSRTYEKRQSVDQNNQELREINKSSLGITPNLVFRIEF
jgi:hypothetical protein